MEQERSASPLNVPSQMMPTGFPQADEARIGNMMSLAHQQYDSGRYKDAQATCEAIYQTDAYRCENLLLLGASHFQLRNFSECIFFNQQCIRIDPAFAEAYGNLGNALKELGDIQGAIQFHLKAIKLKPRFADAYNNLASAHMQLGQTQEAIETFQMALVLNPGLVDAHSNLGNLYKAQGRLDDAKRCYLESIRIKPDFAIAWSNLAGVFKDEGQLGTAIAYYREAIRLCPEFADAHSNLGNALKEQGAVDEAMDEYNIAVKLRPDFAIAHGNLASCLYDLGRVDEAVRTFKHAIQLEPNYPDAYNNLGNALRESGKLEESINCYRTCLRLKPDHPHAYNNLGNALKDKGMVKEAIHCYMTAARLMPRFAAAHSNLGSILKEQGKIDQALAHYHEAIGIDPMFADAYSNMGNAYKDLGRLEDAIRCYTTAIKIKPGFADAYSNLANAYKDGNQIDDAITCFNKALSLKPNFPDAFANLVHSLVLSCTWTEPDREANFRKLQELVATQLGKGESTLVSVQPLHSLVYPLSMAAQLAIAQRYARRARMNVALLEMPPFRWRRRDRTARLRIGYVSSDVGNHPIGHILQGIFGLHDRRHYEVTVYALNSDDRSENRRRIAEGAERFKDISSLMNGDIARLIHSDGINILVNLNGFTKGARNEVFALQPAPIQVGLMGFPGSMGADYIQYLVADDTCIPETPEVHTTASGGDGAGARADGDGAVDNDAVNLRRFYSESIVRMPHSFLACDHKQSARQVIEKASTVKRSKYGLPEEAFVFCCFNQLAKVDPAIFTTWCNILRRVPHSVLWLLRFPKTAHTEANLIAEARKRGVRADQIHFSDVVPREEHLCRGYVADLCLDTPCYNAQTTACDVLWSGTPIVTLAGHKMASRVAASLLVAANVPELITHNREEYEELAVSLALDMDRLWQYRQRLENGRMTSPLFDTSRWVRNLESGFEQMWAIYDAGKAPTDITVEDSGGAGESTAPCRTVAKTTAPMR